MSIDPITLPDGTVVEIERCVFAIREDGQISSGFVGGVPFMPTRPITRVFVPVPDGMTLADAEAALADAGAWVGVIDPVHCPDGARMMNRWTNGLGGDNLYVHRDDLPPTDPDAELVKKMARALYPAHEGTEHLGDAWENVARAALAVVREHEAKS